MSTWGLVRNIFQSLIQVPTLQRTCSKCGSNKTYIRKDGNHKGPRWRFDEAGNRLCDKCYKHFVYNPSLTRIGFWKEYHRTHRVIRFKQKYARVATDIRKHLCSKCGKKGLTHLHHEKYDEQNILAHTVELCASCHAKENHRLAGRWAKEMIQ